jgi:hypothetical protein
LSLESRYAKKEVVPVVKRAHKSKTLWWNGALILALGLLELAAHTFSTLIPPMAYASLIFISSAGNMLLRFKTSEPIE